MKKVYSISFSFDEPKPGVISIPAASPEDAIKLLKEMAKEMHNVVIHDCVDVEEVEYLKNKLADQIAALNMQDDNDDEDREEVKKVN